eukprot:jgi/Chrzof1/3527/Cz12g28210.t1
MALCFVLLAYLGACLVNAFLFWTTAEHKDACTHTYYILCSFALMTLLSCSCTAMGAFKARHYINSVRLFD